MHIGNNNDDTTDGTKHTGAYLNSGCNSNDDMEVTDDKDAEGQPDIFQISVAEKITSISKN